jgi:hypothetical protein
MVKLARWELRYVRLKPFTNHFSTLTQKANPTHAVDLERVQIMQKYDFSQRTAYNSQKLLDSREREDQS